MITNLSHRPLALALVTAAVLAFALASAYVTPRGPVTSYQALATIAAALVVGLIVTAVTGGRWGLVLAPVVFIAVFELARMGTWGPTVDAPASFGLLHVLAFLLGRVPHGLLAVAPMVLGGLIGLALAARVGVPAASPLGVGGWIAASALAVTLAVVGVVIARPATTAPILGGDGRVVPGSVAELTTVVIGGQPQAVMIRGRSSSLPVLLHLAGGPGGTDIGAMRLDTGLEQHFVVATWDQRGSGKSYPAFDPAATLTLEGVVADTIEVTEYLAARFGQERIYIAGQSWGTVPATLAVQRRPELYHALIGTGQMVDIRETDRLFYEDTLAWARSRGDAALVTRLEAMGPPPYADLIGSYPVIVGPERQLNPYPEFDGRTEMTATIWGPEFTVLDSLGAIRGLADTYARLYPQLQELDLRERVPALEVPVWLVMGQYEARGRVEPARAWFESLQAPEKHWVVFEGSSHRANVERPAEYARLLAEVKVATGTVR
jgi:proline iminopeptidase